MSTKEVYKIKVRMFSEEYVETTIQVTAWLSKGVISLETLDVEAVYDKHPECVECTEESVTFTLEDLEHVPIELLEAALAQAKERK